MRPLKDLFFEEYWEIAFRKYSENDTVVNGKGTYKFDILRADKQFWYADPFLFKKNNRTFLFVEIFDNKTEKGIIGYSEFIDNHFTKPQPIIVENFHLSYPYVFEKDGNIYMMPETHEDGCVQLYRATDFPTKWTKDRILINDINAADTVIENDMIITSVVCPENDMSIDLVIYDQSLESCDYNPAYSKSLTKRGAGKVFTHREARIRPSQSCENGQYGCKLFFNKIDQCDKNGYRENIVSEITPKNIEVNGKRIRGIHTYARTSNLECVDVKSKKVNIFRLFYIIKRKLF